MGLHLHETCSDWLNLIMKMREVWLKNCIKASLIERSWFLSGFTNSPLYLISL